MAAPVRRVGRPPKAGRTISETVVPCADLCRKYPVIGTLQSVGAGGYAFPSPKMCCICIDDDFSPTNPRAFLTSCNHEYHYECITTSCEKNESKCPSCRKEITSVAILRVVCGGPSLVDVTLGVREKRIRKKLQGSHLTAEENAELYGVATEAEINVRLLVYLAWPVHFPRPDGSILRCPLPSLAAGELFRVPPGRSRG
jgi:hypothetical protein